MALDLEFVVAEMPQKSSLGSHAFCLVLHTCVILREMAGGI